MDKESVLSDIFDNDPFGILDVKAKPAVRSSNDRLVDSFEEINEFIDKHHREPQRSLMDIQESQLFARLKGIREDARKIEDLKTHDRYHFWLLKRRKRLTL